MNLILKIINNQVKEVMEKLYNVKLNLINIFILLNYYKQAKENYILMKYEHYKILKNV